MIHVLVAHGRIAVAVAALVLATAALYLFAASPVYQASVVVQVDEAPSPARATEDLVALLEDRSAASTEMELLRSRSLIEAVAVGQGLDLTAAPHYLPLVGEAFARRWSGDAPAPAPPGLGGFAWGGERLRIERLAVPGELLEAPLTLTALGGGRYRLEGQRGVLVEGGVAAGPTRGAAGVEIVVAELVARAGTRFDVVRHDPVAVASGLVRDLVVQERGGKGNTGVLELTLEGKRPMELAQVLNAIASAWVRQTVARRAEANEHALAFLDAQLATLRDDVRRAEVTLDKYERVTESPRLSRESQAVVDQIAATGKELSEVELQRSALAGRYGEAHPAVRAVERQLETLRERRAALEARLKSLPKAELATAQLARDVKATSGAYDSMQARAQALRLLRPGALDGVRIVDPAVAPAKPVRPQPLLVLVAALLLSAIAGLGAALARHSLHDAIDTPDDIARHTGLPVFLTVPHSAHQRRVERARGSATPRLLAPTRPTDDAVEALRNLRTALQFTLAEGRDAVVALSSPGPRSGKSFVAANLAVLAAQAGRRVLLLDADLRRGALHRTFGLPRGPGLANLLAGEVALEAAARPTSVPGLDLVTTGPLPANPSELLAGKQFVQVLAAAARRYDLVLVDTAPILAVADGALAAARATVNVLVLRAGHQSMREVTLAVERLGLAGTAVCGVVLNDVRAVLHSYGLYGRKYDYRGDRRDSGDDVRVRDAS